MAHSASGAMTVPTALGQPGSNGFRGHVGAREQGLLMGPLVPGQQALLPVAGGPLCCPFPQVH